ncbi:Glutathione S-transferase 1-1 [Trachymyrmex septentrionalis]|uniref:Glutathione S-transferase 1-1 n=2 Tax=Trachymyrmex septentrionalis TaxID=34720 RepID=A0A195F1H1_9HYME|nr:Glutathione S-transferase 1-1 [Trachymyrmex septentrionalis]
MPIDLYQLTGSPPCRAVLLTAAAVGVDLNVKNVNLSAGEHLKPEFIKMNPQHTVPTLDDNGLHLWESRAIMTYLANQYDKNGSLYPKDPKKRALVDQRLYFDLGTLYQSFINYFYQLVVTGVTPEQAKYDKMNDALSFLDKFLEGENYVAGKTLTLADLALVVTISNYQLVDHDLTKYSNILRWFAKIQAEAPKYNEIEGVGKKAFRDLVENAKKKKPVLYYFPLSPPSRAVMLVVEAIGLEMELVVLNTMAGEHLTPEYEELNPQKTVPFLIDDDLKISESRAIMAYLVDQYGQDDTLYPRNIEARALVNQRLYFDLSNLFASIFECYVLLRKEIDTCDPAQFEKLLENFQIMNNFLEGQAYAAGDNLTIADLSLVASVTTAMIFGFDLGEYNNISDWLERIQTSAPGYEKANGEPVEIFKQMVQASQGNTEEGEGGGEEGEGGEEEGEGGEEEAEGEEEKKDGGGEENE